MSKTKRPALEHVHAPVQHRDGKPPWCKACGLTKDHQAPVSRLHVPRRPPRSPGGITPSTPEDLSR